MTPKWMVTKWISYVKYLVMKQKCFCFLLVFAAYSMVDPIFLRFVEGFFPMEKCHLPKGLKLKPGNHADNYLDYWVYYLVHSHLSPQAQEVLQILSNASKMLEDLSRTRTDVQTCTSWNAPIIWEGTFNPTDFDEMHKKKNTVIGLSVFAVGNYLDLYLEHFLMTADEHFMPGFSVIFYVFVDDLTKLEQIVSKLSGRGKVRGLKVERHKRWQDNSMFRMKQIYELIDNHAKEEANYIFCFDVDQYFKGRFGTEALSESVALLHAWFYRKPKFLYTYESNPHSAAYIESKGDFYYHAAVFGGTWQSVRNLTEACYLGIMQDKERNMEALWHDESHLNKYFWLHKPTKILSPEYCWDPKIGWRRDIRVFRLLWVKKQYKVSREIN